MSPVFDSSSFRQALLCWYRSHGRDLPWRHTRDPYAVLVSEFMLQQTQVETVLPYYLRWMRLFPDFVTLAAASEQEVLSAWQGLGYYDRARNLHRTAQIVVQNYGRGFPRFLPTLNDLPGVGHYTANAIGTFAFNQTVPIVEANIARVLSRLFNIRIAIDSSRGRQILWQRARDLLPDRGARAYNSALIDLGALVCRSRPRCTECPVQKFCRAKAPERLPLKRPGLPLKRLRENHSFCMEDGRILLEQSQDRWSGMWMLPRLAKVSRKRNPVHISRFPFTNHRVTLNVFAQKPVRNGSRYVRRWFSIDEIDSIPLPSPHRRALEMLLSLNHKDLATP